MISELVLQNKDLRKRKAEEKAARLSLEAKEKELEKIVGDMRKEISVLKGILWDRERKRALDLPLLVLVRCVVSAEG